jgi:hypothetical protein
MRKKFYAAWSEGLLSNSEALEILKNSDLIEGIETRFNGENLSLMKEIGLKLSLHRPPLGFNLNFGDRNFLDFFRSKKGRKVIEVIDESDASTVGFHLAFNEEKFLNSDEMFSLLLKNIVGFSRKISKRAVFESVPGEGRFGKYFRTINDPLFIKKILESSKNEKPAPGVLFDVSHNYVIANNLTKRKFFRRGISDYFNLLLRNFSGRINQMHVNVPEQLNGNYFDFHGFFRENDPLTDEILELTGKVIKKNPEIETITLEFKSGLGPVDYAKKTVEQAEILLGAL